MPKDIQEHLDQAEAHARQLSIEKMVVEGGLAPTAANADQGHALRLVIYHSAAAIVGALRERS